MKGRVIKYRGFTITKAILTGFTGDIHNGWDVTKEGTDIVEAFRTEREARVWVRAKDRDDLYQATLRDRERAAAVEEG